MDPSSLPGWGERPERGRSYFRGTDAVPDSSAFETVGSRFAAVAAAHPDRTALVVAGESGDPTTMSWAELSSRAGAVAAGLTLHRSTRGRIGILGRDRAGWVCTAYGAALAGLAVVPMPSAEPDEALAGLCARSGVDLVVALADRPAVELGATPVIGFDELAVTGDRPDAGPPARGTRSADPFLYQFTSGTTGAPKIAVLSHRAVLGAATAYVCGAGAADGAVVMNPLPLEHVGGSVAGMIGALTVAGTYASVSAITPAAIARVIRIAAPTVVGMVPTMLLDLLDSGATTPADFGSVASVVGGATSVDPALIDRVEEELGITFLVAYGQSEAPCATLSARADTTLQRTRTIGRPLPGRDCCIAVDGEVVDEAQVGELFVRGPLGMDGYLADDGALAVVTDVRGWMATGDLCSMQDGVITFHARSRDVVIRGGENLYPAEIEPVIAEHPAVREVTVFGLSDARLGETVAAAVLPVPGATIDTDELDAFAAERLARSKRPTRWFIVEDFPRTSTGKIRRADLVGRLAGPDA
ncbi:MAG TPA: class I adenylate-forming enzyme family protein [Gordonia sp. (in: high G+C Gram-positive bacteria)]|uniref:class I adenylate-forming enzyme family protein n=1 Tax=unclassified Gordonia (in: high G+C Gram-positive bacteria) TaxID=2657482 RepID=UPI000F9756F2|nr:MULTISPECIES: class I adenylate-forming enzyme family protein [unclassified Gordonia (in: high G+C Gram-positive bacteria)]RUP39888.1 MAG: long-chain fatty acid--CoA ligase [Gordonia sp. (in: high G+C Gram-positive bacteria)]HNP56737.1 class I adenylate-forming enzyme family protein [Gordonia sp. (in: high G+C Gram-positive bacteria)]HRC51885.1 class I adenylate-forming enzyme family protein [Gordonia sp. (in: high G+C Gram-positive bacteria)]